MMMEESVSVIPASYPQPVEEDEAQSQSQPVCTAIGQWMYMYVFVKPRMYMCKAIICL